MVSLLILKDYNSDILIKKIKNVKLIILNSKLEIINNNNKIDKLIIDDFDENKIINILRIYKIKKLILFGNKIQSLLDEFRDNLYIISNKTWNIENIFQFINNSKKIINYKVDIEKGNSFVSELKKNIDVGDFCSITKINSEYIGLSTDGVGTKLILANKYNKLSNIGIDLVAMCVNDLICSGIRPVAFLDYIGIDKIDIDKCKIIVDSIIKGCEISKCALVGGETAEMKDLYLKGEFDLVGFSIGILDKLSYRLPKKNKMKKGNLLFGLKSNGIHSNGYTLVRELYEQHKDIDIDLLLKPTKIYNEVLEINNICDNLLGVAHITGGGFQDNINRILPKHLNFKLYKNWDIPKEFIWIQKKSGLTFNKMFDIFNMGIGMVLIMNTRNEELIKIYNLIEIGILY